jgi:GNAT superfamily N-acetyltransferase
MELSTANIRCRRVNKEDIDIMVEYRIRFLKEFGNQPEERIIALEKALREYFSEAIPANEFVGFLAEYDNQILGTAGMVVWRVLGRFGFESGRQGYVCNVHTVPEARRHGISSRLLVEVIKEAKSLGLGCLHLRAHKDALNIYKKAGFTEPHHIEMQLRLGNE